MESSEPVGGVRAHPVAALAAVSVCGAAAFAVVIATRTVEAERVAIDNLVQLFAYLLGAIACFLTAQRVSGVARRAWGFFALAGAAQTISQLFWVVEVLDTGREPTVFVWSHVGFLLFFPFAAAGLLVVSTGPLRASAMVRRIADGVIIAGSLLVTTWGAMGGDLLGVGTREAVVTAMASLGDLLLATLALLILVRYRLKPGPVLLLLSGLIVIVAVDMTAVYLRAADASFPPEALGVGWVLAFFLLAAAAVLADGAEIVSEEARPSLPLLLLPYVFLLLAMSCMVARRLLGEPPGLAESILSLVLVMVVLLRQLLTLTETHRLLSALADREQQMRHQALHDPLTGLANRALFTDRVEHAVTMHARSGQGLVVMFCDLDDFKHVNDSLGHAAGDALLVELARRMRLVVRAGDTVARLGGDEFALLLEQPESEIVEIAQRMLTAVCAPLSIEGTWVFPSASIGSAVLPGLAEPPRLAPTVSKLLADADAAMYVAKAAGKSRHAMAFAGEISLAPYQSPDFDPLQVGKPIGGVVPEAAPPVPLDGRPADSATDLGMAAPGRPPL